MTLYKLTFIRFSYSLGAYGTPNFNVYFDQNKNTKQMVINLHVTHPMGEKISMQVITFTCMLKSKM